MKRIILLLCALLGAVPVQAAVKVFACEPEWGSLVKEIGGDDVDVFTATTALQDVHQIQARPSLIAQLRKANLLVCTGAGLEIGWLPVLLGRAGNPAVQTGTPGNLATSDSVALLNKPDHVDRAEGDVHPDGNPHIHLDPRNLLPIAQAIADRLAQLDAGHADAYAGRLKDFDARWNAALAKWDSAAESLKGMPVVVHHDGWVYLNNWLGLRQVGELEPKPGVPPTSAHLSELLTQLKQTPPRAVIRSSYQDPRASEWLAGKINVAAVQLPYSVGADAQTGDLFGLFDEIIAKLKAVP